MLNHTNNMPGRLDPGQAAYTCSHRHPIQALKYSSPSPDLPGFTCNIGAPSHHDPSPPFTKNISGHLFRKSPVVEALVYPSPPPSSSEPKRSVPLPSETESILSSKPFGGILDSPLIMKHEALRSNLPISPPATLPTQTQELPPTDHEASIDIDHDSLDPSFSSALVASLAPPNAVASSSHLLSPLSPVSPVSPQWDHNRIPYPSPSSKECFLLSEHRPPELFYDVAPPFRPILKLLDIPESYSTPSDSWGSFSPRSMHSDIDSDIEMNGSFNFPRSEDCCMFDGTHDFQDFPHPSSPSIHNILSLPDLDDDPSPPNSPSSPSLRSFSSLPGDDDDMLTSPGSSLLALPGAVPDDDFLPSTLGLPDVPASEAMSAPASTSSRSLLLLDDPNDVPPPRSPSPENFDLDPSLIAECSDPDFQRLYELRTRSQASERAAKQLETYMLEQGSRYARTEARNARRKEKERSREVSALLRLKLDERGVHVGDQQVQRRSARKMIDSMAQLVAKMMFRRHDTSRPLANKLPTVTKVQPPKSPLSRSLTLAELEEDEGWPERKPIWTLGFEQPDSDEYLISPIHF
ncbi:hypothetical protein BD779DRAFT_1519087 [Infundibulicybe gibba]|nr:hypothetical protein BD779DRAFT_1519087 [Infundibulicybe gibba]